MFKLSHRFIFSPLTVIMVDSPHAHRMNTGTRSDTRVAKAAKHRFRLKMAFFSDFPWLANKWRSTLFCLPTETAVFSLLLLVVESSSCPISSCDCRGRRGYSTAACEFPTRDQYWVRAMVTGGLLTTYSTPWLRVTVHDTNVN